MTPLEQEILTRAGAPLDAPYYMIFDQSSHLDYDWLVDFITYYTSGYNGSTPVQDIYPQALALLQGSSRYFYSICEMDYFRQYLSDNPGQVADFQAVVGQLVLAGGGITSPDNLLSHGEAFIRNYLVGQQWLRSTVPALLPIRVCWIPDDFGHDPELPATLQALGMKATSFWRVPGGTSQAPTPSLITQMYDQGLDFIWQASDGSRVLAHWLQGGYPQGSGIDKTPPGYIANIQSYVDSYWSEPKRTGTFGARTPYMYVPLDNDFSAPVPDLQSDLDGWNTSGSGYNAPPYVWALALPFATFVELVLAHDAEARVLSTVPFDGRPYWTGHYMSRPALKIMHYDVARTLLCAEALALMAGPGGALSGSFPADLLSAWDAFMPSTHHDFVNGTAMDSVYTGEQTRELRASTTRARGLVSTAMTALTGSVAAHPQTGETAVLVANSLGVPYNGVVELASPPAGIQGVRFGDVTGPVQQSADGGLLFLAKVPPVTYTTGYLTAAAGNGAGNGTPPLSLQPSGSGYTFRNEHLTATISPDAPYYWGLSSFLDADGNAVLDTSSGPGNHVVVYDDQGDIYEFGYEYGSWAFAPLTPTRVSAGAATVVENGPLRVTVQVPVELTLSVGTFSATLEYSLAAGEPFLRMSITGTAPSYASVTVQFTFAQTITGMWNGTPNHWTSRQQASIQGWSDPVFRPTHRFVLPQAGDATLAAVYHPEVPAWAWKDATLMGCVLRNTPNTNGHGAWGTDGESHTLHYALRPVTGLGEPTTGQPLAESLRYAWPPVAAVVGNTSATLAEKGFVAYVADGTGMIMAAKPGDVTPGSTVLRLYQPTNGTETLSIQLPGAPRSAIAVTALEDPIEIGAPKVSLNGSTLTVVMPNALATVQITW
jgi:alpha-mannosidase